MSSRCAPALHYKVSGIGRKRLPHQFSESVDGAPENGMIRGLSPVVSAGCAWHAACIAG